MERAMFNRLPDFSKTYILEEFGFDNINDVVNWEAKDREELQLCLREELDSVMVDLITDLDNEGLEKLNYIMKKYWNCEYFDITKMSDYDCILVHNYLHGIHDLS